MTEKTDLCSQIAWCDDTMPLTNVTLLPTVAQLVPLLHPPSHTPLDTPITTPLDTPPDPPLTPPSHLTPYINCPVLLWSTVTMDAIIATKCVTKGANTGLLVEGTKSVAIPTTYIGLFEIISHPPPTQPQHYPTVADVARVMPKYMFTKTRLKAIEMDGKGGYTERVVPAGSTLRVIRVFTTRWKSTVQRGLIRQRSTEVVTDEMPYLQCETHDKRTVIVSHRHQGRLYAVFDRSRGAEPLRCVYRLKDLVTCVQFPVTCRLVLGKPPLGKKDNAGCFTGVLELTDIVKRTIIIGSSLHKSDNSLFELDTSVPLTAKLSSTKLEYSKLGGYNSARDLCVKYADSFSTLIKPYNLPIHATNVAENITNDITDTNSNYQHHPGSRGFTNLDTYAHSTTTTKPTRFLRLSSNDETFMQNFNNLVDEFGNVSPFGQGDTIEFTENERETNC